MSDRNLTELEWKKFAKGRNLKDAALVKALADLERATKGGPDAELAALADIEKQAEILRKAGKADKELAVYLDGLDKALDKQRKLATAQARKSPAQATADAAGGDEEDSPALLTSKMVPLIRQVRQGEPMQVLLANTGKDVAVLMARRAISPARRKLMTEYLGGAAAKFIPGTCIWEENAYTFVLQTQAGGLARKIRAALLGQVQLRLKVRVRGEDPNDVDDDGEAVEQEGEERGDEEGEPGQAKQPSPTIPEAPPLPVDPLKARYETRMAALEPRVLAALKAQAGDVSRIRAVAEFARGKAQARDYKAALAALEALEKLLPGAPAAPGDDGAAFNARLAALLPRVKQALAAGGPEALKLKASEAGVFARKADFAQANALLDEVEQLLSASGGAAPPAAATAGPAGNPAQAASQVAFTQSRLAWDQMRKFLQGELRKLESAILAQSAGESDFAQIRSGTAQLYEVLEVLDERLIDKLDEALNAEGEQRRALHGEARGIIAEYLDFVNSEPLMQDIDRSGFIDLQILPTLNAQLQRMDAELGASFARY